jgi:hypothetical protein
MDAKGEETETSQVAVEVNDVVLSDEGATKKEVELSQKSTKKKLLKKRVEMFMEGYFMQSLLAIMLMTSLFLPDLWVLGNPPESADDALYSILTFVLFVFTIEIVVLSVVQNEYPYSFFFWMDLLGTASIILDIGWIAGLFMPSDSETSQQGSLLRAARAAKLGARYGRIMRLLKLMKFFKYCPCFAKKGDDEKEPTMSAVRRVSSELSSVLSRRVAALVLFCVLVFPWLDVEITDQSIDVWLQEFAFITKNNVTSSLQRDQIIQDFGNFYSADSTNSVRAAFLGLESPFFLPINYYYEETSDIRSMNRLRYTEFFTSENVLYTTRTTLDLTRQNQWAALYGLLLIIIVIVILFVFSASFHGAVDVLIVIPLEKMMTTLRSSATVMLKSMQALEQNNDENSIEEELEGLDEELETAMLEKMVEKLARIVKHIMPNADVFVDSHIDTTTATWLTQNYTTTPRRASYTAAGTRKSLNKLDLKKNRRIFFASSKFNQHLVDSANFDVLEHDVEDLVEVVEYIFDKAKTFDHEIGVCPHVFRDFIKELSHQYVSENPYHNFYHAVDVMHTTNFLLRTIGLDSVLTDFEIFGTLLAAIAHDVGHPGLNNSYLVKSKSKLAMQFNDLSPLENMHCSLLFEIMSNPKFDIMSNFSEESWRDVRKLVVKSILGTDMVHHFEHIRKTQVFYEVNGSETRKFCTGQSQQRLECLEDHDQRMFVIELLIHSADVSNPYKKFSICKKWADLVVEEFFRQGDRENAEKRDISPMMNRKEEASMCNMQMGFIEFVVSPLVMGLIQVFPSMYQCGKEMVNNMDSWGKLRLVEIEEDLNLAEGDKKNEERKKLTERLTKFKEKMAFVRESEKMMEKKTNQSQSLRPKQFV